MRTKHFLPAVLAALTVAASADLIIETKIESPQMNSNMTTKIKGGKVRANLTGPMGAMSSIIDSATGESVQLIHGQKMAMKTSAEQMRQALEMSKRAAGATPDKEAAQTKPKATGQKEKIGEYECEIYTWSGSGTTSRFWVALKHPQAALLKAAEKQMRSGALGMAAMGPDMSDLGPALKTETEVANMKTVATILSVKEESVDASEFEVPKDYQVMDMSKPGGASAVPAPKAPAPKVPTPK
jgi:Domain of unknown function (DUF4412)